MSSGTPKPRGAEPTMSKARVNGERTKCMGKSKMSETCWPQRAVKSLYLTSANFFKFFNMRCVPLDMAKRVRREKQEVRTERIEFLVLGNVIVVYRPRVGLSELSLSVVLLSAIYVCHQTQFPHFIISILYNILKRFFFFL